ncbi:MAG: sigma-70 family RNA polymerase sigma factor [Cyclobacteriaceae bacterium]
MFFHFFLRVEKTISKSEEEILQEYRKTGDSELLGRLFNDYMHLVYGLCLKYLKSRDDSQDAVMSIYEKVSQTLLTNEVTHFKSWLYMVSKNYCLMELRKSNPEKNADVFMETTAIVHLNDEQDLMGTKLDALDECIEKLKKEQKECVKLFFLDRKSYQQVNEITGIELKKVKSNIQNGKRNLKICLEAKNVNA